MLAMNMTLTFGAAMMLFDWTSCRTIIYDSRKFMINVMKNDQSWAEQLNVSINVDVETVSSAALKLLEKLQAVTPELVKELETKRVVEPQVNPDVEQSIAQAVNELVQANTVDTQKTVHTPRVVPVNALHVVADVVSLRANQSDALEFGLAVIAAAIKCDVLQHVAVQVHSIGRTLDSQPASTNAARLSAVWDTLVLFLDKLARLKESVAVESELYQTWVNVIERLVEGTLKVDDLEPFRKLVDLDRQSTCGNIVLVEQVPEKLGFDMNTEHWNTEAGINAIFVKSQTTLDKIFEQLPISTMDLDLWDVYLNKTELTKKIAAIAATVVAGQTEEGSTSVEEENGDFVIVDKPTEQTST